MVISPATVKMEDLILKVLIMISPIVPWHILTPSESTFLSRICIDSLPGFLRTVRLYIIQMYSFTK